MKNKSSKILSITFLSIIFLSLSSYIILESKDFSENENRYLAQKPKFDIQSLLDGEYTKGIEKYVDDQFLFRDESISMKSKIKKTLGNKDINGVYLADDGYLIEKILEDEYNYENLEKNIDIINNFIDRNKDKKINFMVVPTTSLVLKNKLPKNAPVYNQERAFEIINKKIDSDDYININEKLENHNEEYIYYRTDHHWTSLGAYYAYEEYMNHTNKDITDYRNKLIKKSDEFLGSLYSKVLDKSLEPDTISMIDDSNIEYTVEYNFNKSYSNSIYDLEKLKEKDKYSVFLGGNHPELKIVPKEKNNKNLLIIKDSFANALVPFLLEEYSQINIVDLRYLNEDINEYISENKIEEILILYNIQNLATEKTIEKLK